MMTRLNEMHVIKKQNAHMSKEAAREIIRKIPVEVLAKEWLSKEDATVDMRAYLVDQILPTLILGVERLLREVDEKGLSATNRFEPEFNPINFLAQYLMRNNPRFSNFAEASPYVRGLREVSEEIKQELFTFEDNRLARIKAETRRKRMDRERYEQEIREGKERRRNQLISQFSEWTNYGERNTVELAVLQNSLSFFLETVELLPPELQEVAKFGRPLEPTDETGKTLSVKEFAQYISLFVEDLPSEIFNLFMVHMSKCAATQNASADRENRRIILTNLFLICDYGVLRFMIADRKLGLLDRVRVMILFEKFWDMLMLSREEPMATLRNPRRWPVVEVEEVDDILYDAWQEEPDGGITPMEEEVQNKLEEGSLTTTEIEEEENLAATEEREENNVAATEIREEENCRTGHNNDLWPVTSTIKEKTVEQDTTMTYTSSAAKPIRELSAYSDKFVNLCQFVQMFETFIGPHPESKIFATLVHYVTDLYQDNEPDKTDKLLQAKENATNARKKAQLNALFEKWDNDASGFLELEDVTDYMCKFKDGQEVEAIRSAQFDLKKQSEYFDGRLSNREFRQFLNMVINELPGKETFDLFVEFLMNSVERSYGERIRGEARKKWLQQINMAALTGGTSMEPVYKAVFQALYKDAETHGGEKRISASITMLEKNKLEPSRGELMLRVAACTPEDCQYMLGKPLYKNMKGISFQAIETGKPVHVPRVAKHGNIYFWNYNRNPQERSGSFVAIPLKDNKKRVFGTLGVDTMIDPKKETIFTKHEIQFFQGVAKAFSIAYHYVEKKRKFVHVLERAMPWFHCRCPHVVEITVYFIEPNSKDTNDYVLRKIMVMDNNGQAAHVTELVRLERKDNLFRRYLFDCVETSYTVVADIHDMRHIACPIRDPNGKVVSVVDLNTGKLKNLPKYESREAQRLLRLLQRAFCELSRVSKGEDPQCVLVSKEKSTRNKETSTV
ncbi:unnamed protein product, partial [Candidula unifasciata]